MMQRLVTMAIVLLLSLGYLTLLAQTPEDAFNRGNELYRTGKFQDAVKEYETILKHGYISAEVYFNLGNAYYRMDNLAQAILAYERAARLHPHDPDIEHNLRLLNLKTIDRIEPVPELFLIQWMRSVNSLIAGETVRFLFVLSWILLFGSLAAMYIFIRHELLRAFRIVLVVSFLSTMLWGTMIGIQSFQGASQDQAIVTTETVTAKSSPDVKSVDAFVVHEGLKVKLTDAVGDWVKITLADGKVGWILSGQCKRI